MNFKEAETFLQQVMEIYNKIPKKEKTFMQISGYPHYENVCSNILSFYLNPKEEHGLNNIVLKALLSVAEEKTKVVYSNVNLSNISVLREYTTESGNRIDIVLQNEEIVIGIENKIMAQVYNNLRDYSNTLENINKNAVKILLSLKDETKVAAENGFVNISYNELFNRLKQNLSEYEDKQNKWYIYFIDFMKNLEEFEVEKEMEEIINEWIKYHQEEINGFYELLNIAKNSIYKKINGYGNMLQDKISPQYRVRYWKDTDLQLGSYILLEELGCNLDTVLTIEGWQLRLNIWKKMNRNIIKQALVSNGCDIIEEDKIYVHLYKLDYDCKINEVAEKAKEILDILQEIN